MNLKELVNRDLKNVMNQEECLYIIKEYIRIRKGKIVNPIIGDLRRFRMPQHELQLMINMSNFAINWLRINRDL